LLKFRFSLIGTVVALAFGVAHAAGGVGAGGGVSKVPVSIKVRDPLPVGKPIGVSKPVVVSNKPTPQSIPLMPPKGQPRPKCPVQGGCY
jgi:hypothetical protein